jgi:uncharacterized membrane protein HdeD (DUF308 family)
MFASPERLTCSWWLLTVRGVVAVIVGLLALTWSDITLLPRWCRPRRVVAR